MSAYKPKWRKGSWIRQMESEEDQIVGKVGSEKSIQ